MKLFHLVSIVILSVGSYFSIKSMDHPGDQSKDLDEKFLHAASRGNLRNIRKFLDTLPKNRPNLFAKKDGKGALQLAVEHAMMRVENYWDCAHWDETFKTIECILEYMILDNYMQALEAMGEAFDWLNLIANSENYLSEYRLREIELGVRHCLTNLLQSEIRKIKAERRRGLETAYRYSMHEYRELVERNAENQLDLADQIYQRSIHPIHPASVALYHVRDLLNHRDSYGMTLSEGLSVRLLAVGVVLAPMMILAFWMDRRTG